jgi:hypothetical protein
MSNEKSKERPVFSGLQIFDVDVPVGQEFNGHVILDEALDICRSITLGYDEQFTIQLASDAGIAQNGKRFVYRLEGFNENWVKTSELNPNITYNSLRTGSYTLHVRMLNDDGSYGEVESELDITIRPPLWRTRWAMLLYILFIAGAALLWRRWYMRRQERYMEVQTTRRELEKQQWMNEMRMKMSKEHAANPYQSASIAPEVVSANLHHSDLVAFLRQVCSDCQSTAGRNTKITFLSVADHLSVNFDAVQLAEVFQILFRNSATFSPNECLISVGVARTANGEAQIQVADSGIGIKDEYKEHAFDPIVNGEGIGLDRVKAIIDAHSGTIRIEDNPGGGTIFVITLPLGEEIEEAILMDDDEQDVTD